MSITTIHGRQLRDATVKPGTKLTKLVSSSIDASNNCNSNWDMGSSGQTYDGSDYFTISGVPYPTANDHIANKIYVDEIAQGLDVKESCVAGSTVALTVTQSGAGVGATLTNNDTQAAFALDGISLSSGDRVLIKDQSAGSQNGIYSVTTVGDASTNWVLTRTVDADGTPAGDISGGSFTFLEQGTTQSENGYVVIADGAIVVDTDDMTWAQFSGAGQIAAGSGLSKSGNTIDVNFGDGIINDSDYVAVDASASGAINIDFDSGAANAGKVGINTDGSTIEIATNALQVKVDGINDTHIDFGGGANQVNAADIGFLTAGGAWGGTATDIDGALEELRDGQSGLTTLADGKIYIGDGSNQAQEYALSGDVTMGNTGVTSIGADKVLDSMINFGGGATQVNATDLPFITGHSYGGSAANVMDALEELEADIGTLNTLADGKIYLGDGSNVAQEVTMSGDITMSNTGATTIGADKVLDSMINFGGGATQVNATDIGFITGHSYGGSATNVMDALEELETAASTTYAFKTFVPSSGSNVVANTVADTINFTASTGITITGSGGDTLTIASTLQDGGDLTASLGVKRVTDDFELNFTADKGLHLNGNALEIELNAAGAIAADASGLAAQVDGSTIEIATNALQVKADGINDTHIDFGGGANQVNAADLPFITGHSYGGSAANVMDALEELETDIGTLETLADGKIYIGDGSNVAQEVTMSGDITIDNTGATAIGADKVNETHLDHGSGANQIDATSILLDSGGGFSGSATTVQGALEALDGRYIRDIMSDTTTPDGAEDEYPLPGTDTEQANSEVVYVNGVAQNPGGADDYTMAAGTGVNSGKRVVLFNGGSEPLSGDTVVITYMKDIS